ncbi:MAG: DEAD/DEAH box helicase [Defluviitaleaceae bacterium]|nr:DEAD/DEAH box helicase [Defluviitaleaceae bacterium]
MKKLLPWQEACLNAWQSRGFRGIAHVVTGAGKTILAAAAIKRLLAGFASETGNLKIKIVIPKTFLMYQWHAVIREELEFPRENIGFFSGTHKSNTDKPIMLYVINSARDVLARHIVEDVRQGYKVLLIADECHHYGSDANARIFGYAPYVGDSVYTLGLSATPWCTNFNEVLVPALGKEIYRFGFLAALKADIISRFALFNISVPFTPQERQVYDELSDHLGYAMHKLNELCPNLGGRQGNFFAALENIIHNGEPEAAELAKTVLILSTQRKDVVYKASYRIDAVVELARRIPKSSKIIIFGERIETAVEVSRRLSNLYPNETGLYHSKVPKELGLHTLRQFESEEIRILITCKTLDEGLNITKTDVGIVVSSTGSHRQRVQRLGRVLRKKEKNALFYYLYIGDTMEEDELLQEIIRPEYDSLINRIGLNYNQESGIFENPQYSEWEESVVKNLVEKHQPEEIIEFMRNADRTILTEDWLTTEEQCLKKLRNATSKDERNYHIATLLIIRARKRNV